MGVGQIKSRFTKLSKKKRWWLGGGGGGEETDRGRSHPPHGKSRPQSERGRDGGKRRRRRKRGRSHGAPIRQRSAELKRKEIVCLPFVVTARVACPEVTHRVGPAIWWH